MRILVGNEGSSNPSSPYPYRSSLLGQPGCPLTPSPPQGRVPWTTRHERSFLIPDDHDERFRQYAEILRSLAAMVDRLISMVCLTYSLLMHLGQRLRADAVGLQRRGQWTVPDRVSWFWCGQQLSHDPGHDWSAW